ncbi:polysaccharide pyruvyl transferase family protein [Methylophaga sp.]|uniref:polysaccharide pyruvyl transferase family protein n=1 Tax=Methylophaga sp. TaxID=2024840 RepID=UPI0014000963|nr:polysaccharide pyruvyl transferase family protein [Methylophaga sp.]MTI63687.1 polysaccharide pyruvyl transferase family protein [Methylophaga sp.]
MVKPIKLHWSQSKPNFGDALSPLICEAVSGREVIYAKPAKADMVAIGSLLHRLKEGWLSHRVHVWGTGYIKQPPVHKSRHYYHAIRGQLSASAISNHNIDTLGDPGLLAGLLLPENKRLDKKYRIGLVAHYKDKTNPLIKTLTDSHSDICEIDIYSSPLDFLKQLSQCEIIFSSAMHGLIAADALDIPNGWIKLSENLRGNDFKFQDYYSIFNLSPSAISINKENVYHQAQSLADTYYRPNIDLIKNSLVKVFPDIL